jgi:hypothetical protein
MDPSIPRVERSSPSSGVVNIDVLKRTNVSSARDALARALDELRKREHAIAQALLAPADKSEFGFGHLCGSAQENLHSVSILEHCLNESDPVRERHEER